MNLERFHNILSTAWNDINDSEEIIYIRDLANHLQQLTEEPADADHQKNVVQSRSALFEVLQSSPSNDYPPSWKNILQGYGLSYYLAENVLAAVNKAFAGNDITPQAVYETLRLVHSEFVELHEVTGRILVGFDKLDVETEYLEEGDVEIAYTVPRELYEGSPSKLGKEFREIELLLKPFAEMAMGHAQEFKVRSISSSDFMIVLGVAGVSILGAAKVVRLIAAAVLDIIVAYKNVVEIRLMKSKLADIDGASDQRDAATAALEALVQAKIDTGMAGAAGRLFEKFNAIKDEGRANEIRNHVELNMKKIAARIDHGFEIETRMGELPEPKLEGELGEGEGDGVDGQGIERLREVLETISAAHREQLTFEREGEPILSLPDPSDDEPPAAE